MNKQEKSFIEDELDKVEVGRPNCSGKLLTPAVWALLAGFLVIFGFLIFSKNQPSSYKVADAAGDFEKTMKLFPQAPKAGKGKQKQLQGAPVAGGTQAAWFYAGRNHVCANCGWQGSRLSVDAMGNHTCPRCTFCPNPRRIPTAQGVAAVTGASPKPIVIKPCGFEAMNTQRGVMAAVVYGNSHASRGKLKHGDIIYKFNHKKIKNIQDLTKAVAKAPVEKRVVVRVYRMGKKKKLNVMVGEGEMDGVIVNRKHPVNTPVSPAFNQTPTGTPMAVTGNANRGASGYLACTNCGFQVINRLGTANGLRRCPRCDNTMVRQGGFGRNRQGAPVAAQGGGNNAWAPQGGGQGAGNNAWCPPR